MGESVGVESSVGEKDSPKRPEDNNSSTNNHISPIMTDSNESDTRTNDDGYEQAHWETRRDSEVEEDATLQEIPIDDENGTISNSLANLGMGRNVVYVSNPEKHGEGFKDAYITFEVVLKEANASTVVISKVRRRFQDFSWLHAQLMEGEGNQGAVIPPLPDRHRLDYLDRFTPEFLRRRQMALERFLRRILAHPILSQNVYLHSFLSQPVLGIDSPAERTSKRLPSHEGDLTIGKSWSDSLVQAFMNTSLRRRPIEERFTIMKRLTETVETNLDRLAEIHGRLATAIRGIQDIRKEETQTISTLSSQFSVLESMLSIEGIDASVGSGNDEARIMGVLPKLRTLLGDWGQEEEEQAMSIWIPLADSLETRLAASLTDAANYARAALFTLKIRDQRQFHWQDIVENIGGTKEELAQFAAHLATDSSASGTVATVSNDVAPSSMTRLKSGKTAVMNYLSEKVDQMRGIDPISARADRIRRLEGRLGDLQESLQYAQTQSQEFDERIGREFVTFLDIMNREMVDELVGGAKDIWSRAQTQLQDRWNVFSRDSLGNVTNNSLQGLPPDD